MPIKNSFKNWFLSLGILLLAPLVLSACQALPLGNNNEPVTLKYWGLWEPASVINQIANDYKKDHPNVNIVYEKKSPQQYREALESQINSDKGPDILMFHNTWVPMLEDELTEIPINMLSANDIKKNFYPIVFKDLRNSKKQFVGVPTGIDGLALYYNEDIFKAAGVISPPSTWQELKQVAAKLTVRGPEGNIRTAGVALGTASNVDHFSDILGLMILQNGGDIKNPTDQRSSDALEFYTSFTKGETNVWDETQPSSTISFVGGNLAMYFAPSWRVAEIKKENPTLNFKVAQLPQLDENKISWASYWAIGVSSKSPSQKQALEFLKYLQEDQTLIKQYTESAKSPGRLFGQPYPKQSLAKSLVSDPYVGAYINDAPYMQSFYMASRTYDNGINDQVIKAYEDAVNANLANTPATHALAATANNIEKILAKYNSAETPAQK